MGSPWLLALSVDGLHPNCFAEEDQLLYPLHNDCTEVKYSMVTQ